MGGCLFGLAVICFIIGFVQLISPDPQARTGAGTGLAGLAESLRRPAAIDPQKRAESRSEPVPGALARDQVGGENMVVSKPQKLDWIGVGQRIYTRHPVKGELMAHVLGKMLYAELWQRGRGAQVPWVPTGNSFYGFWLEGGLFLLNWQNRFYLLDESQQLSDAEIARDFMPYARQFAQSDQTADVYFAYPPASWHIDDIGKFRVEQVEGEGLNFRPGATGRFIHASGDSGRALVLEDYEGGGQDTVWIGYLVSEEDLKPA